MRVALLHRHLRSGVVASAIKSQARYLKATPSAAEVHLVLGEKPVQEPPVPYTVVPQLAGPPSGQPSRTGNPSASEIAASVERAVRERFGVGCDILHANDPPFRGDRVFARALELLAGSFGRVLVQLDRLPETEGSARAALVGEYPTGCYYATGTSRHRGHLLAAGLDPGSVFVFPGEVPIPPTYSPRRGFGVESSMGRRSAVLSTQSRGRRNVGEALLLSHWLPPGGRLDVVLPPSAAARGAIEGWKRVAQRGSCRVSLAAEPSADRDGPYGRAFCAVTTALGGASLAECLEPVMRGVPLVGRYPAQFAEDFLKGGIELSGTYSRLAVPADAFPREALRALVAAASAYLREAWTAAFADDSTLPEPGRGLEAILPRLERRFSGATLDFGALDGVLQASLLERLHGDEGLAAALAEHNPFLDALFDTRFEPAAAAGLRSAVRDAYSASRNRELLFAAYRTMLEAEPRGAIDQRVLFARLLDPETFPWGET